VIQVNEPVLIYLSEKRNYFIEIGKKGKFSTDLGEIDLKELIGKPYGYVGKTHLGKEFCCLKPTTADLMLRLKRLTTIVYPKDLGEVLIETSIGYGSRVCEVGTGSGALTLALARFVGPSGRVYSYDRRQEFIENARKNVMRVGLDEGVEFFLRDVARDGFLQTDSDAIFIDVPEPWEIVPWTRAALKSGYHLASWSPNIEQVKRMVDALNSENFKRIRVREIIEREILVRERGIRPKERGITHTAYLVTAQKVSKGVAV